MKYLSLIAIFIITLFVFDSYGQEAQVPSFTFTDYYQDESGNIQPIPDEYDYSYKTDKWVRSPEIEYEPFGYHFPTCEEQEVLIQQAMDRAYSNGVDPDIDFFLDWHKENCRAIVVRFDPIEPLIVEHFSIRYYQLIFQEYVDDWEHRNSWGGDFSTFFSSDFDISRFCYTAILYEAEKYPFIVDDPQAIKNANSQCDIAVRYTYNEYYQEEDDSQENSNVSLSHIKRAVRMALFTNVPRGFTKPSKNRGLYKMLKRQNISAKSIELTSSTP